MRYTLLRIGAGHLRLLTGIFTLHILASATVSDDARQHVPDALSVVWHALKNKGYAVTSDQSIGLPEKFRPNFSGTYFNDWTLRHDEGDLPADRLRARDVIRYQWDDERLSLQRHDAITITDRAGIAGRRERLAHPRRALQ